MLSLGMEQPPITHRPNCDCEPQRGWIDPECPIHTTIHVNTDMSDYAIASRALATIRDILKDDSSVSAAPKIHAVILRAITEAKASIK